MVFSLSNQILLTLLTIHPIVLIIHGKECPLKLCNYESVCQYENNEPICDCVQGYYTGPGCTKLLDHCSPNPCNRNAVCEQYLGHFHCQCPPPYSGQNCTSRRKAVFEKFHVHFNHMAEYGVEQSFLLAFQELEGTPFILEFFKDTYYVEGLIASKGGKLKTSQDLRRIADRLGLRHSDTLPYNEGYYVISKATFWQIGVTTLVINMKEFDDPAALYLYEFNINVYRTDDPLKVCTPIARQENCMNPRQLLKMAVNNFNYINPIVERSCGEDSTLHFKYIVKDYLDNVHIHTFKNRNRLLKIPPYTLLFNYEDTIYPNFYILEGIVDEISANGNTRGTSHFRCYFQVTTHTPKAVIIGGSNRQINVGKSFTLDATKSRDYNRCPKLDQQLQFEWSCSTSDQTNEICKANMGEGTELHLPENSFQIGQTYKFSLKATSKAIQTEPNIATQLITPVLDDQLLLHIDCIRNCKSNRFSPGQIVHLLVNCYNCDGIDFDIEWNPILGNDQRLIIPSDDPNLSKETLEISVKGSLEGREGRTSVILDGNTPPSGGSCSITPETGTELDTEFRIECSAYEDLDMPLSFTYYLEERIIEKSLMDFLVIPLYRSKADLAEVKIDICDELNACISQEITVQLEEAHIGSSVEEFQRYVAPRGVIDLAVRRGDHVKVAVIFKLLGKRLKQLPDNEDKRKVFKDILNMYTKFNPIPIFLMEFLSSCLKQFTSSIKIDSEYILKVSEGIETLTDNLGTTEICELNSAEFLNLNTDVFQMIGQIVPKLDTFSAISGMQIQRPDDPFHETYPDYGEMSFDIIETISNWQNAFHRIQKYLHHLGAISFNLLEPNEPPLRLNTIAGNLTIIAIEKTNLNLRFVREHLGNSINLSKSILEEFSKQLDSNKMVIQVGWFAMNPFGWYPDQFQPVTDVMVVNVFRDGFDQFYNKSIVTENYYELVYDMNANLTGLQKGDMLREGYVNATDDMPVYEMVLPENGLLLFEFKSFSRDMRLVFRIGKRPRGYMMLTQYQVVSKVSTKFWLRNEAGNDTTAYMALTPFDMTAQARINFTFVIHTQSCMLWDPNTQRWTSSHCRPSPGGYQFDGRLHCQCNHLSSLASKFYITPNSLQFSRVLILTLKQNYQIALFFVGFAIFFMALLLMAWIQDRKVRRVISVYETPLQHTLSTQYQYLITVVTGSLPHSGTTANVYIELHGRHGQSQKLNLYPGNRFGEESFKKNSVTVFLFRTEVNYGRLQRIRLGHDNYGPYPSWYCDMMRIKDKHRREEYIFMPRRWLSEIFNTTTTAPHGAGERSRECMVAVAAKEDLNDFKFLFYEHFNNYASNAFVWRILDKTQSGDLSRRQKIFVLWCQMMAISVIMIAFYGRTTLENYEDELENLQVFFIDVGRMLLVGVLCFVVSLFVVSLVTYMFVAAKRDTVPYKLVYRDM